MGGRRHKNFDDYYIPEPNSGCWLFLGGIADNGYGKFWLNGRTVGAHRFFYERTKGPIPSGGHLDHLCRTKSCVNPEHLEVVTCRENVRRGKQTKINATVAAEMRTLRGTMTGRAIAKRFSVSPALVCLVQRGRLWGKE